MKFHEIEIPAPDYVIDSLKIRDYPVVSEWLEENIQLKAGYAGTGSIKLRPYQVFPVNNILNYQEAGIVGPPQSGKSLMADAILYYCIKILRVNFLLVYNTLDTAKNVFKSRLRQMIKENKAFSSLWSGKEDDLTIDWLYFKGFFGKIASAELRNSLATFSSAVCIVSELSKIDWKNLSYDAIAEIRSRAEAYSESNRHLLFESTPDMIGDTYWKIIHDSSSRIYKPHVMCPECAFWQVMEFENIGTSLLDDQNNFDRIRSLEKSGQDPCFYECQRCKAKLPETSRLKMIENPIYASPEMRVKISDTKSFVQKGEFISGDGNVVRHTDNAFRPIYWYNKLVITNYSISRAYIEQQTARLSESEETLHIYVNNHETKFFEFSAEKTPEALLNQKINESTYIGAPGAIIAAGSIANVPDGILFLYAGIDTMGSYFKYVIQGFGANMESWILRWGNIQFGVSKELALAKLASSGGPPIDSKDWLNYRDVLGNLMLPFQQPFITTINGSPVRLEIENSLIDRGGHNAALVDFICANASFLRPWIGYPGKNPKQEDGLCWLTKEGWYQGCTEQLSMNVLKHIQSPQFHMPRNMSLQDGREMILSQYHYSKTVAGIKKYFYQHGGEDHYYDCLNYIRGMVEYQRLNVLLFDPNFVADRVNALTLPSEEVSEEPERQQPVNENNFRTVSPSADLKRKLFGG